MSNITNPSTSQECIELTLPSNSAYVSAARLTASSIANRMGFNTEEIEDIKAAVSEACTYIIKQTPYSISKQFKIQFKLIPNALEINLTLERPSKSNDVYGDNTLGIMMIEALMDKILFSNDEDSILNITMTKVLNT
jgi:serine/threonine-protein kinase RsbW